MKPLNILHFSQDFRPGKPNLGGFTRIMNLCADVNHHFIFTLTFDPEYSELKAIDENIWVIPIFVPERNFRLRTQIFRTGYVSRCIYRWILNHQLRVDIIFGHSQLINYFILNQVRNEIPFPPPLIWEANAVWGSSTFNKNDFPSIVGIFRKFIQRLVFNKSDAIVAQTNASKKFICEKYAINYDKIIVITNAIDKLNRHVKAKNILEPKSHTFLMYGLFDKLNGFGFVSELLERSRINCTIDFIGTGDFKDRIIESSLLKRCNYLGHLSHSEMIKKLLEYDFVIIPRVKCIESDLFVPTKIIEAMANGVIVLASDVGGLSELIEHEKNGFLFKAEDEDDFLKKLNLCMNMPENEMAQIRTNAYETIANGYLWSRNHIKLNSLYKQVVNS